MSQSKQDAARKRIGDMELTVYRLDPMVSMKLWRKVLAVVMPTIAAGIGKFGGAQSLFDSTVDLGAAASEFFARADDALLEDLVQKFGEVTETKGGWVKDTFPVLFRGKLVELHEWLWFCLQSEYGALVKKALGGTDLGDLSTLLRRFGSAPSSPSATSSSDSSAGG